MSPHESPAAPEALLAQTAWMRRLARSLVHDDASADDLVQDAVVAALRSPPRDRVALPAWLSTTVRNGARQLWRRESRRAAREAAGARSEAQPSAAEVVARAEEHGLVVRSVLALEEPYRSAVLLRFFDDLPPREVARRTGVPVETARARIRRGIERLRERLDGAHGGDGSAWRLALMPLALYETSKAAGAGSGAATGNQLTTGAIVMAGTGTAVVGAVALAAGAAAGWWFGAASSEEAATKLRASADDEKRHFASMSKGLAERDARADRLEASLRAARTESDELRKQIEALTAERDAAKAAAAAAASPPAPAPKPAAAGPRFAFGQFNKLNEVDWKSVGENLSAMAPLVDVIMTKMEKDGEVPGEEFGKLQQHNGPLVAAGLKVMKELPGTGVNGSFTHPAFQVNAIAAALDAAKKPLTPAQATALEKIGREFSDEDARRLQGYDESAYALQKTIDEAELRRRFFEAAFEALAKEQRDALTPPSVKGLLGFDLYSDGLVWMTVVRPLSFKEKDTDALVTSAAGVMNTALKLPPDMQDAARGVVLRWARDLPASLVTVPQSPGIRSDRAVAPIREAAKQTLVLLKSLVADLKLEGAQAAAARKWPVALVPSPSKAE